MNQHVMTHVLVSTQKQPSRIGWIVERHPENNRVKINFEGNPSKQPVWAAIGRAFSLSEVDLAIDNQLDCRIEFVGDDLNFPSLVDIYFSVSNENTITIKGNRIVLQAEEKIMLRSGEAYTTLSGLDGRQTTHAQYISSIAEKTHQIKGSKISLN